MARLIRKLILGRLAKMAMELDFTLAKAALSVVLASCILGCTTLPQMPIQGNRYRVFFPHMALDAANGERITSIEIAMSCGRFRSLAIIPNDWSVEVISPTSERTTLKAEAGHGATTLWNISDLDGVVVISIEEASCFDITTTVVTTILDHERRYQFTRSNLILKR